MQWGALNQLSYISFVCVGWGFDLRWQIRNLFLRWLYPTELTQPLTLKWFYCLCWSPILFIYRVNGQCVYLKCILQWLTLNENAYVHHLSYVTSSLAHFTLRLWPLFAVVFGMIVAATFGAIKAFLQKVLGGSLQQACGPVLLRPVYFHAVLL